MWLGRDLGNSPSSFNPDISSAKHVLHQRPLLHKKILKHLDLWDQKARLPPKTNAPPIDVFPTYDEQPGLRTDDYTCPPRRIRDPDLCASGALHCRGLFLRSRAVAGSEGGKTTLGQSGFLCPKSRIFSQFIVKFRLDNKAVVRYLNLSRLYDNENCRWVSGPTSYWDSTGYSTQP